MLHRVQKDQRNLAAFDAPGATVRVSDPIRGADDRLSAGFTEYTEASRLTWTFDYDEVFFMLEGYLEVQVEGRDPVRYEAGDLGYIEKGARTTIIVPERAYMLHVTHPAWRSE
ncbi:MAG: cupin domain-containing protein [Gemmatimonadaceae bacterium]|nr:cupin domain-containing protein [Gemmatimonadaceae bacterium]